MQTSRRGFLARIKDIAKTVVFTFSIFPILSEFAEAAAESSTFDLIALKGGSGPDELFLKGIAHLGGIGRFVKKGQSVLIKPNIGWDRSPDYGANTDPSLIKAIVTECFRAGASNVYIFDHTCDAWQSCYRNSGVEKAATDSGAKIVPANSKEYYVKTPIPRGKVLKEALVHKLFMECDVFINVPVLKHHSSAGITASMKNLMGVVWDRSEWHRKDLHQCIADFATLRKPNLCVLDGWRVMIKNGPKGYSESDSVKYRYLFLSTDPVAIDTAGASVLVKAGSIKGNPEDVRHIKIAKESGIGRSDLDRLNIKRITI